MYVNIIYIYILKYHPSTRSDKIRSLSPSREVNGALLSLNWCHAPPAHLRGQKKIWKSSEIHEVHVVQRREPWKYYGIRWKSYGTLWKTTLWNTMAYYNYGILWNTWNAFSHSNCKHDWIQLITLSEGMHNDNGKLQHHCDEALYVLSLRTTRASLVQALWGSSCQKLQPIALEDLIHCHKLRFICFMFHMLPLTTKGDSINRGRWLLVDVDGTSAKMG